jgi:hypothetical protein
VTDKNSKNAATATVTRAAVGVTIVAYPFPLDEEALP